MVGADCYIVTFDMLKKTFSNLYSLIIISILIVIMGYVVLAKKLAVEPSLITSSPELALAEKITLDRQTTPAVDGQSGKATSGWKTFKFDNFHGENTGGGFSFDYPASWKNDGQYFSPVKIYHYDIVSTDAPMYYDLVAESLFDTSDLKYQLKQDKRRVPDSKVKLGGHEFQKYDLIDYNSTKDSPDRVIVYVGPKITFNGESYYLVFHWEEKPLAITIPGNDPKIFESMIASLKFVSQ